MDYRPRIADQELRSILAGAGAAIVEGPRACGKTSTARQVCQSEVLLDVDENARAAAVLDPALILDGDVPRLIDEWQLEPAIWNHIRRAVDERGRPGQFVLTGSSVPADDVVRHTGAGRIARLRMRPMSLFESGHSTGTVSLKSVLSGEAPRCTDPKFDIRMVAERITTGGWPALLGVGAADARRVIRGYIDEVARADISRVDGTRRDPVNTRHLLRSLARNVATSASARTLVDNMADRISLDTAYEYLDSLERLMVVENQPGWKPDLRSKSRVRTNPKRHFVDPSLAAAAIGADTDRLLSDLNYTGFLFESLVIRDLRIFAQPIGGSVFYYQDNTGLEVDAIVETPDGRWAAFEIKLGHARINEAAANLLKLRERADSDSGMALAVIVPTGFGFLREDGVGVIPVAALGP